MFWLGWADPRKYNHKVQPPQKSCFSSFFPPYISMQRAGKKSRWELPGALHTCPLHDTMSPRPGSVGNAPMVAANYAPLVNYPRVAAASESRAGNCVFQVNSGRSLPVIPGRSWGSPMESGDVGAPELLWRDPLCSRDFGEWLRSF